ncbi:MAG: glycine cleavage T C-terminal barrel domain-containing protein [Roseiflexaceae bacterium]
MTIDTTTAASYQATLEGSALVDEADNGRIWMRGRDRAALLHRLSTNNIERLKPGQGTRTVLTTPIGRIIDLLTVHALEDALLLLTSPAQGPLVYGHLRKNIFFNDQVTLEPAGRTHGQLALYGPAAAGMLAELGGSLPAELPPHHSVEATLAGVTVRVIRRLPIGGDGFTLLVPVEGLETVRAALLGAGVVPIEAAALDTLRIEQGYGVFGRELSQEYIPLETGLADAISFTKGCYVGQEIIARMESRGRLAKQLRGLRLSAPLEAPAKLLVEGKEAGDLTSATVSPRFGPIALAYVRSAHAELGSTIGIEGSDVVGTVVELPFAKS